MGNETGIINHVYFDLVLRYLRSSSPAISLSQMARSNVSEDTFTYTLITCTYVRVDVGFSVHVGCPFMEDITYSSIKCLEDPALSHISAFH